MNMARLIPCTLYRPSVTCFHIEHAIGKIPEDAAVHAENIGFSLGIRDEGCIGDANIGHLDFPALEDLSSSGISVHEHVWEHMLRPGT